jgi:hypothetical protein
MNTKINFKRVNNDVNGNPRYVCHFLELLTDEDEQQIKEDFRLTLQQNPFKKIGLLYDLAVNKARKIGGKKYRGKDFGGGIVFQSYNIYDTEKQINEVKTAVKN